MKPQIVVRNPADIQWFGLNQDGSIAHLKYRFDGLPAYRILKTNEPITIFSMVQSDGVLHIAAKTISGVYYIKVEENGGYQQELRVVPCSEARYPYLFFYKTVLYVCCMVTEQEQTKFMLKSLESERWIERSLSLFEDEGTSVRLDEAIFTISNQGKLHGFFRYLNHLDECVLSCLEYDIEHDLRVERRIFALKQKNQRWHLGLDVDSLGMPHYVWTISYGGTAVYYYVNADREARSSMPLLINGEHETAIPHFLFVNEFILVLFWNGDERVECVYSFNRGQTWTASSYIPFDKRSPLQLVQSIRRQSRVISPEKVLGFHMPYFRPLEFIDLFNPLVVPKLFKSTVERLHWIQLQMGYLYNDYLQHTSQLKQKVSELSLLHEASEEQIRHLMREADQLKKEEQKVLQQLKSVYDIDEEEPFSLRFIR